ncbi:MAG TPA: glycosyltransferase family 4 protein [Polyangiaceae bacterium]|nr:glycosyltransferase family 4 protein [Polyangiaceae bacterium]
MNGMAVHENGATSAIRVLSLIPTFWPRQGGAQMVLAATAAGLRARVDDVVLTRGYAGSPRFERYPDLRVFRYPNPAPLRWKDYATGNQHVPFPAKACVAVFDVLGSLRPLHRLAREADLIHVHFPLPLGLSVLALRKLADRPVVVTVHGNADIYELPRALSPLTRAVLKRADAVVSVSHDLAAHLETDFGVHAVTIVNGIDTDLFRPAERQPSEALTLVSISRIVPRKNIPILIAAVEALAREQDQPPLRLLIAGTGPSEGEVERLAASSRACQYLGFVDEDRKRELLAEADFFVQLSVREGLSVATLEAMASGVPCIVSDLPGVREPVTDGETGFLVPNPESVDDVIAVLRRAIAQRSRFDEMRRATRRAAEERYSLQAMAEGYFRVYQDVLARRAP